MTSISRAFLQGIRGLFGVKTLNTSHFDGIGAPFFRPFSSRFWRLRRQFWSFSRQIREIQGNLFSADFGKTRKSSLACQQIFSGCFGVRLPIQEAITAKSRGASH
jgi:hypothetical protein